MDRCMNERLNEWMNEWNDNEYIVLSKTTWYQGFTATTLYYTVLKEIIECNGIEMSEKCMWTTWMNQVKNEEVQRRTGVVRAGWSSRARSTVMVSAQKEWKKAI